MAYNLLSGTLDQNLDLGSNLNPKKFGHLKEIFGSDFERYFKGFLVELFQGYIHR